MHIWARLSLTSGAGGSAWQLLASAAMGDVVDTVGSFVAWFVAPLSGSAAVAAEPGSGGPGSPVASHPPIDDASPTGFRPCPIPAQCHRLHVLARYLRRQPPGLLLSRIVDYFYIGVYTPTFGLRVLTQLSRSLALRLAPGQQPEVPGVSRRSPCPTLPVLFCYSPFA